ncbi:MAG TPA: tRNA dihydrouridine(20/20a) synthase DusA, partial [Shewanella sp.]|nr:tRNA dihydrouridine(20/20a) synthase DusA [Shewanella sp.]
MKTENHHAKPYVPKKPLDRTFSIAPMLDWTDRPYRYFARLMSCQSLLERGRGTTGALR